MKEKSIEKFKNELPDRGKKQAAVCLFLASFFLPFGYDAAFATLMKLTGSYWTTDLIFYFISACFFGLYFFFSKINPFIGLRKSFTRKS